MMRNWVSVTMLLAVCQATAQPVVVDTLSAMQPWSPYEEFTFPHFIIPGKPQLAERIERDLCIDFLEVDPDTAKGSIFQQVWGDRASAAPQRLSSLSWTSEQPLPEVLSVSFTAEGCGAYCEGFTIHYNYDLRDGHRLQFDSLFTATGRIAVDDSLRSNWQGAVEAHISLLLHDSLPGADGSNEYREWREDALSMYRQCLLERADYRPYVSDVEPLGQALRVHIARCSAHANRNLDELDAVEVDLPYKWLRRYLRPGLAALFTE